jgi:hypothetical protein
MDVLPSPPPPPPPPQAGSRVGLFVVVGAVVALLAVVAVAVGAVLLGAGAPGPAPTTSRLVTASTTLVAQRGPVVFSDEFHNATSGWSTQTLPSGTTFSYTAAGYVIVAMGSVDHFADAPYQTPVQQVAISVTATQSTDSPIGAGYGVSCWRGTGAAELRYDFLVSTGGDWKIDRRDGGIPTAPQILMQGKSDFRLGSAPLAVQGMCATLADLRTSRLLLFVGTQKLADLVDSATAIPDAGWLPDMLVTSEALQSSTVTATHFEVRDLAG